MVDDDGYFSMFLIYFPIFGGDPDPAGKPCSVGSIPDR